MFKFQSDTGTLRFAIDEMKSQILPLETALAFALNIFEKQTFPAPVSLGFAFSLLVDC